MEKNLNNEETFTWIRKIATEFYELVYNVLLKV